MVWGAGVATLAGPSASGWKPGKPDIVPIGEAISFGVARLAVLSDLTPMILRIPGESRASPDFLSCAVMPIPP